MFLVLVFVAVVIYWLKLAFVDSADYSGVKKDLATLKTIIDKLEGKERDD